MNKNYISPEMVVSTLTMEENIAGISVGVQTEEDEF